ncbi:hypothetical protein D3C75_897390 [compost metagenome]
MLAGKLPAGTGAAEHRTFRGNKIYGAFVRGFSAPGALSKEQFTILRGMQLYEALLAHQTLAILDGSGIGCERIYIGCCKFWQIKFPPD